MFHLHRKYLQSRARSTCLGAVVDEAVDDELLGVEHRRQHTRSLLQLDVVSAVRLPVHSHVSDAVLLCVAYLRLNLYVSSKIVTAVRLS